VRGVVMKADGVDADYYLLEFGNEVLKMAQQ
jgi:hypothetical protein